MSQPKKNTRANKGAAVSIKSAPAPIALIARQAVAKQSSRMGIALQPDKLASVSAAVAAEAKTLVEEIASAHLHEMVGASPVEILRPREKTFLKLVSSQLEKAAAANLAEIRKMGEKFNEASKKTSAAIEETAKKASEEMAKIAEAQRLAAAKSAAAPSFPRGGYSQNQNYRRPFVKWQKRPAAQPEPEKRPVARPFVPPRRAAASAPVSTATATAPAASGTVFIAQ